MVSSSALYVVKCIASPSVKQSIFVVKNDLIFNLLLPELLKMYPQKNLGVSVKAIYIFKRIYVDTRTENPQSFSVYVPGSSSKHDFRS